MEGDGLEEVERTVGRGRDEGEPGRMLEGREGGDRRPGSARALVFFGKAPPVEHQDRPRMWAPSGKGQQPLKGRSVDRCSVHQGLTA